MKPPPPGPATNGMVAPMVLAAATAASTASPPCFSTVMAASVAPRLIDVAAPPVPMATGCFVGPPPLAWLDAALASDGRTVTAAAAAAVTQNMAERRMGNLGTESEGREPGRCEIFLSVVLRPGNVKPPAPRHPVRPCDG